MRKSAQAGAIIAAAACCISTVAGRAAELESDTQAQLRELRQQNERMQQQMRKQQELIDELTRKVSDLPAPAEARKTEATSSKGKEETSASSHSPLSSALGKVYLSGEGAAGFFESQSHGQFPNSEFRVDEAKLFVEAPIWGDVSFFTELNLFLREDPAFGVGVGEAYVDVENLSRLWNRENQLNLRVGAMDIPFGEEYLTRDAIDNPLISHSIMDFWGVDEGLELYGSLSKLQYVVAVQNGGISPFRDFTGDKAVTGRVSVDPARWLRMSASAMRTGQLDANQDHVSALWLGSGFVRSLGSTNTTRFQANILEGDVQLKFRRTTIKAAGGVLEYEDNDPVGNHRRDVSYYSVEGIQPLCKGLYAAVRWSQAFADKGFPIVGNGNIDDYFGRELTRELSLLSVGLGYRWSKQLVLKAEYSIEWGRELDGTRRDHENLGSVVAAFAF